MVSIVMFLKVGTQKGTLEFLASFRGTSPRIFFESSAQASMQSRGNIAAEF